MKWLHTPHVKALFLAVGLGGGIITILASIYLIVAPNVWRTNLALSDFAIDPTSMLIATAEVTPDREAPDDTQFPPSLVEARTIYVRNVFTGKVLRKLGTHNDDIVSVAWSPDGTLLVSSSLDSTVKVWDAQTGALLHLLPFPSKRPPDTIRFSPSGEWLAVQVGNGVQIWSCATWQLQSTMLDARLFAWSSDSSLISGFSNSQTTRLVQSDVHLWRVKTGSVEDTISVASSGLNTERDARPSWSSDGRQIAVGDIDPFDTSIGPEVRIFDVSNKTVVTTLPLNEEGYDMGSIAWSSDGRQIAVSYKKVLGRMGIRPGIFKPEGIVEVWEVGQGSTPWKRLRRMKHNLEKGSTFPGTLQFTQDSTVLVFGARNGAVQWWEVK